MILHGRSVSPGVFEGRAHVLDARAWIEAARAVSPSRRPAGEVERLRAAQSRACVQLERVEQQLAEHGRRDDAEIFAAHISMMRDPMFLDRVESAFVT
jgi:phosphotransferase system enzyme I (PtsI)